jgi:hypothetical protein
MTDADYRDMASEIRDLIPLLLHAQAVADLRLLADRYERLAQYLEGAAVQDLYSQDEDEMDQRVAS